MSFLSRKSLSPLQTLVVLGTMLGTLIESLSTIHDRCFESNGSIYTLGFCWSQAGALENARIVDPKGSRPHKAAIGDPLKDTSGPSLNILIKLMAVESLVFAATPWFTDPSLYQFFSRDAISRFKPGIEKIFPWKGSRSATSMTTTTTMMISGMDNYNWFVSISLGFAVVHVV